MRAQPQILATDKTDGNEIWAQSVNEICGSVHFFKESLKNIQYYFISVLAIVIDCEQRKKSA